MANYNNVDMERFMIIQYKEQIIIEMKKMGASDNELLLVREATVRNAIRRNRRPEDVAWAILQ